MYHICVCYTFYVALYQFMLSTSNTYIVIWMNGAAGLFLGGRAEAEGARSGGGFTHLLSVGCPLEGGTSESATHLSFPDILDDEEANMLDILEQCVKYIDDALGEEGARVLVHCEAGRSRSAAVVCAWLMSKEALGFEEAVRT